MREIRDEARQLYTFRKKERVLKAATLFLPKNDDDYKTKRTNTHLVVIVDVAHVALGLDAIVAVREYYRGLRREEDDEDA